jgi:hypothetical protein
MHIRSELEVDPAALAHEMVSLLRRVRVPVVWWALRQRQIDAPMYVKASSGCGFRP